MKEIGEHRLVREYLDTLCSQIRCREVHEEIRLELLSHIEEQADAQSGLEKNPEEAIISALAQMGDPVRLGKQLHRFHRPQTEWGVLGAAAAFAALGVLAMYAIEASHSLGRGFPVGVFLRQLLSTSAGAALAAILYFVDYRKIRGFSFWLFGLTALAAGLIALGPHKLHQFQGVIAATPFLFMIALAGIFSSWDWAQPGALLKISFLFFMPLIIYFSAPNMFLVVIYLAGFLVLAANSRAGRPPLLAVAGLGGSAAVIGFFKIVSTPYLLGRFKVLLAPEKYASGTGYQLVQAGRAIREAGPWGQGFSSSLEALPGVHSEFVFAYLVHALGWVAGLGICLLAAFFLGSLLQVARRAKDRFGSLLVTGLVALFAVQFGWNLLMIAGLVPIAGAAMPFVSFGSQSALQMAAVGVALSVYRRKDLLHQSHS